jgi:hypothetical protein
MTVKPQVVVRIYELENRLRKAGLSYRDIITLIQDRTSPRLGRSEIENTLKAIKKLEGIIL